MRFAAETLRRKSKELVIVAIHDRSQREQACSALEDAGYEVIAAPNCQAALTACRGAGTDPILVTEVRLPEMWGLDLARAATQFRSRTRVVCIADREPKLGVAREIAERGWRWLIKGNSTGILEAILGFSKSLPRRSVSTAVSKSDSELSSTRNIV